MEYGSKDKVKQRKEGKPLKRRGYVMDTMVRADLMYAAEMWRWRRWEKVQNKCMKMSMGLDRNTPTYIWQMKAGGQV